MEDIVITAKRKKTEIITGLICFVIANLVNVYAIIKYNTSFSELYTTIGYIFAFSIAIYIAWTIIRIIFYGAMKLFKRKDANSGHI